MKIQKILLFLLLLFFSCGGDILEDNSEEPEPGTQSRIYMVGGLSAQTLNSTNTVAGIDVYYPETDSWEQNITDIPVPVSFAAVVAYNGKIYVMGGFNNTGTVIATTQIYDIATNTWTTGANMSEARANHTAVVYDGKIYVLHGTGPTGNAATAWTIAGITNSLIYTISSNTWASTGVADTAISNRGAALVGDTIYYLGGKSAASTYVNTNDGLLIQYNALTTAVTELTMSSVRAGFSTSTFTDDNGYPHILVMGGTGGPLTNAGCYVFNSPSAMTAATFVNSFQYLRSPFTSPQQVAWTSLTNLPASLGYGSAVVSGSRLYYFGGAGYLSATTVSAQNVVYSYDLDSFPSGSWTIHDVVMPRQRFGHVAVVVE